MVSIVSYRNKGKRFKPTMDKSIKRIVCLIKNSSLVGYSQRYKNQSTVVTYLAKSYNNLNMRKVG